MSDESTACLAASNPGILAELPDLFCQAIGTETCVWVNNLNGRLYRDICNSNYFYKWFCAKLTHLMNKGPRPGFVEKFEVLDAEFGSVPPLLSNVQWCPMFNNYGPAQPSKEETKSDKIDRKSSTQQENGDDSSDEEDKTTNMRSTKFDDTAEAKLKDGAKSDEFHYYAASIADMAFRSGIKFTIATK